MAVSPVVMRRLMRELTELRTNPPEGIRIQTSDEDMLDVTGIIEGPEGTPYAGGYFKVKFKFTEEFPTAPPKCWFATKIFHPNVSSSGEICVNTLKKDWQSSYGIGHILVTVKCLLIYPNPESALDEEAGKLLLEDYSSYCDRAKLITSVHATPRIRPAEFDTPSASSSKVPSAAASTSSTSSLKSMSLLTPTLTPASSVQTPPMPVVTRKSVSPAPPTASLKLSPANDKDTGKERHPSPSPLSTADSNVDAKLVAPVGLGIVSSATSGGTKAVKRAATGAAATGAEKRKKALKRL